MRVPVAAAPEIVFCVVLPAGAIRPVALVRVVAVSVVVVVRVPVTVPLLLRRYSDIPFPVIR